MLYPYMQGTLRSALLLDAMESLIYRDFIDVVDDQGTQVIQIIGGFTLVCQPCDVGIMKPFKSQLAEMRQARKASEYPKMGGLGKILTPAMSDLLKWLDAEWNEFSAETIIPKMWTY